MRSDDFDAATELAARTVEDGCPTAHVTKRPCSSCTLAAERIRNLSLLDMPDDLWPIE